jgi:hypothetical protein
MKLVYLPTNETRAVTTTDRVARLERRPQVYGLVEEIKVFGDLIDTLAGDGAFKWEISDDLVGWDIVQVKIFITETGGACTCQLSNRTQGWDILFSGLTIPAGEYSAATNIDSLEEIDETKNDLSGDPDNGNDRLWLDVDQAGGKGLGLIVTYGRDWRP